MCVLFPWQDLVCSSSVEVAWKVLMTLRTFLKRNEDVLVCDLLRSRFLQILQQLLVECSSASLQGDPPLWLGLGVKSTGRVDGWRDAVWDKVVLDCWYSFSAYVHEEIYGQSCADLVSFCRHSWSERVFFWFRLFWLQTVIVKPRQSFFYAVMSVQVENCAGKSPSLNRVSTGDWKTSSFLPFLCAKHLCIPEYTQFPGHRDGEQR